MRYYIIAGERSGDLHGGNLVKSLRKHDADAVIRGFGGEHMEKAGVELAVHYEEMAFMGIFEVFSNLRTITRYIRLCKEDINAFNPDVIILIDYGGFNRRIAHFGRVHHYKVFYYIPPKVWAWYQRRARELKRNVDRLFVILPFEKDFYKKYNWDVDYVGNPVVDAVKAYESDASFTEKLALSNPNVPLIALLPGSRKQELARIIPLMADVVKRQPAYHFVVAAVDNLPPALYDPIKSLPNVSFVYNKTYDLLQHAQAAIVTSGTATLETALFHVPQVVVYRPGAMTFHILKRLINVPYISLVNLIAGREVVKELIHTAANPIEVSTELVGLVDGTRRDDVLKGYDEIADILDAGGSASSNAAALMWQYLNNA